MMFAFILAATIGWILLPLIPAIRELVRPVDADPLTQVGHDAGDLAIFAQGFRRYLEREMPPEQPVTSDPMALSQLRDGTPLLQLNGDGDMLRRVATPDGTIGRLVVAHDRLVLPGRETFLYELLVRERFVGGPEAVYRALLAEGQAELGPRSRVLRWLHVEGDVALREGVVLEGRGSANGTMWLADDVRFRRIRATRLVVGTADPAPPPIPDPVAHSTLRLPRSSRQLRGFVRVDEPLVIPPGATYVGTLVVYGDVEVGKEARIAGSLKVHGNCVVEARAIVDGSIVAKGDIRLVEGARVGGPVIAEGDVAAGPFTCVGRPDAPTSIAAERITLSNGAQVFGALSARVMGVATV
ncbi:MAG: hypothetical protein U0132_00410 [Gemmatimonadaceae bacterium]